MFVDSTQAFESVNRNKIMECLAQYNVPAKLIRLIELTQQSMIDHELK